MSLTKEQEVLGALRDALETKGCCKLKQDVTLKCGQNYISLDAGIYMYGSLSVIVEVKHVIRPETIKSAQSQLQRICHGLSCDYGIITDGKEYELYNAKNPKLWERCSLDKLLENLQTIFNQFKKEGPNIEAIRTILRDSTLGLEDFTDKILYDGKNYLFDLNDEYIFFEKLLGYKGCKPNRKCPKHVYRYMSFRSAFLTLRDNKYRMNSIVAMNDKSEIDFFDRIVSGKGKIIEINHKVFISSFSFLPNNLTMWRLYGNDGKGVCLKFGIKDAYRKNFNRVHYVINKKDKVLRLLKILSSKGFKFSNLDVWKHFFKPKEYKEEQEYRMVIHRTQINLTDGKQGGWDIIEENGIISPYMFLNMDADDFPLQLEEVILGPKCPEWKINCLLLENFRNNKKEFKISHSKIKSYR